MTKIMFTTLYFVILTAHVCVVHVQGKPEPSKRAAVKDYSTETISKSELSSGGLNDASLEKQILAEIGIQSMPPAISKVETHTKISGEIFLEKIMVQVNLYPIHKVSIKGCSHCSDRSDKG